MNQQNLSPKQIEQNKQVIIYINNQLQQPQQQQPVNQQIITSHCVHKTVGGIVCGSCTCGLGVLFIYALVGAILCIIGVQKCV